MALPLASTLLATGCTADPRQAPAPNTTAQLLASLERDPITVELDAKTGGVIQGKGTRVTIPPDSLYIPGGQPADIDTDGDGKNDSRRIEGTVTVELREFLSPEDMMEAGLPTVTSSGDLLESGGAFDVTIRSGDQVGRALQLLDLRITPERRPSTSDGMELWVAYPSADKFGWDRPLPEPILARPEGASFTFPVVPPPPLNNQNGPGNCDRRVFFPPPPNRIAPVGPVHVQLVASTSRDAAVFFFPEGLFSVIRLSRDDARAASGTAEFVSPVTAMSSDLRGKLVTVSVVDGKYYFDQRVVSLDAPDGGDQTFGMTPVEVTAEQLRTQLRSL